MAQAMIDKGLSILMTCHQTIRVCTRITDAEEHEIADSRGVLRIPSRDSGIFSFTGPAEACKTTILDLVSTALCGRAVPYERAQPTKNYGVWA